MPPLSAPTSTTAQGAVDTGSVISQVPQIEAAATNLLTYSQTFSNAIWAVVAGTVTTTDNALAAPDGTTMAATVQDTSAVAISRKGESVTIPNDGLPYTASLFVTYNNSVDCKVGLILSGGTSVESFVEFNPQNAVTINAQGSYLIEAIDILGVTWLRVSVTATNNNSGNVTAQLYFEPSCANVAAQLITAYWGAQIEQDDAASSYIPTVAQQVTRQTGKIPSWLLDSKLSTKYVAPAYSIDLSDKGKLILPNAGGTITLPAISTVGDGFFFSTRPYNISAAVTFARSGADTISIAGDSAAKTSIDMVGNTLGYTFTADATNSRWVISSFVTGSSILPNYQALPYTVAASDKGKIVTVTSAGTLTLPQISTVGDGFWFHTKIYGAINGAISIARSGTDTISAPGGDTTETSVSLQGNSSDGGVVGANVTGMLFIADATNGRWLVSVIGAAKGIQVFTANGNWICPEGVRIAWVTAQGGGGGGGSGQIGFFGGGGGGAGAAAYRQVIAPVPGTTYAVTIGAGGAAQNAGAATSLGALLSLAGGGGASGKTGGVAGAKGNDGENGYGGALTSFNGSNGGGGIFGGSGKGGVDAAVGTAGDANTGAGGGGGGATDAANGTGGAGGSGFLIVEW